MRCRSGECLANRSRWAELHMTLQVVLHWLRSVVAVWHFENMNLLILGLGMLQWNPPVAAVWTQSTLLRMSFLCFTYLGLALRCVSFWMKLQCKRTFFRTGTTKLKIIYHCYSTRQWTNGFFFFFAITRNIHTIENQSIGKLDWFSFAEIGNNTSLCIELLREEYFLER